MAGILTDKQQRKGILLYGLITVIIISAISLLQWVDTSSVDLYYYLALILALGIGILHVGLMNRFLLGPVSGHFGWGLLATILLMIAGGLGSAIVYHFIKLSYPFLTFVLVFILPFLCRETYLFFLRIPASQYKIWFYPVNEEMPDLDMIDLSQIEVVQFVFNKKPQDATQTNFTSKAPLNMTLGQLFFIFINDYNEKNSQNTIVFLDQENYPHGWLFFRKKKWFAKRRYFDPDLSFRNNAIQPNEFIFAHRVPGERR
jgi:MFS family permease